MPAIPITQAVEHLLSRTQARFFVDTCFILHPKAFVLLEKDIISFLHSWKNPIVLPYPVIFEVEKHSEANQDPDLTLRARKSLKSLNKHKSEGSIRILGNPEEKFADQIFLEVFTKFRQKYDLLLFTQDNGLCRDLLRLNSTESTTRCNNEIWVAWHNGKELVASRNIQDIRDTRRPHRTPDPIPQTRSLPIFQKFSRPRELDNSIIGSREKAKTCDLVFAENGKGVALGNVLAAGGEGEIFAVNGKMVAKIYFPDRRTAWRSDKLAMMCQHQVKVPNVSWPIDRLFTKNGDFLGFLMPMARGKTLQHSVFGKATIQEQFPRWNRTNLVNLATTIATKVNALNQLGVIVGNLNPMNFLVQSETEVHLVDVDSVQICDFPCPVGMVTFRAPEITEPSFEKFLRNDHHEAFALASLIFMILMGGKPPFSFQGGGDPAENIRKGNFPYVTDRSLIPAGAYRYIWSFFPNVVCDGFARSFTHKDPRRRPSPDEWVYILSEYAAMLASDKLPEALHIWPTSFRPFKGEDYVQLKCTECKTVFQTSAKDAEKKRKYPEILCGSCSAVMTLVRKAGENHTCSKCAKHFRVSFAQVQRHGTVLEWCDECVNKVAQENRVCKQCNSTFKLDVGETRFHLAKNLNMPKRCASCRGKIQHERPQQRPHATPQHYPTSSPSILNSVFKYASSAEYVGELGIRKAFE